MQHNFRCVSLISRSWRTWEINCITPYHGHFEHCHLESDPNNSSNVLFGLASLLWAQGHWDDMNRTQSHFCGNEESHKLHLTLLGHIAPLPSGQCWPLTFYFFNRWAKLFSPSSMWLMFMIKYVVASFETKSGCWNWTLILPCMEIFLVENGHLKGMCYNEIGLCAKSVGTIYV